MTGVLRGRGNLDIHTHKDPTKAQGGEAVHLQHKREVPEKNQRCWYFDLEILVTRSVRKWISVGVIPSRWYFVMAILAD